MLVIDVVVFLRVYRFVKAIQCFDGNPVLISEGLIQIFGIVLTRFESKVPAVRVQRNSCIPTKPP